VRLPAQDKRQYGTFRRETASDWFARIVTVVHRNAHVSLPVSKPSSMDMKNGIVCGIVLRGAFMSLVQATVPVLNI
jgi:hypothetical protein